MKKLKLRIKRALFAFFRDQITEFLGIGNSIDLTPVKINQEVHYNDFIKLDAEIRFTDELRWFGEIPFSVAYERALHKCRM